MTCRICEYDRAHPNKPSRAVAEALGVAKSTVNNHRNKPHLDNDEFFDVPREAITSRGASIRDPETGSWQKISYSPAKAAAIEASRTSYDDLKHVVKPYNFREQANTSNQVLHVLLSDPQIGKVDETGGTPETLERFYDCVAQVVDHAQRHDYAEIVVVDLGDVVEGFSNTAQQAQTNDLSLTDQIRAARRAITETILHLAPHTPKLTFITVPSNHCQVRTGLGNKARANAPDDDYGILIHDSIQDAFELLADHNVAFRKPAKWEESVTHNGVGFTHGHLAGQPNNMPQWFKNQAAGKRSGLHEATILAYGHFHHLRLQETANAVMLIGAPTLDPGSAWHSNTSGDRTNPGLLTFDTENGHLKGWHVYRPQKGEK